MIDLDELNGKYSMLACFQGVYFVFYGGGDLSTLVQGKSTPQLSTEFFSATEIAIVLGSLLATFGYRQALKFIALKPQSERTVPKDWPESAVILIGASMFLIGTAAAWYLKVYVMPDKDMYAGHRLAQLDPYLVAALLLGDLVLPLGIIILSYAYARYKRFYMLPMIVAVVAMQAITGFVTDEKAIVMKGGLIVLLTKVLIDGKLPKIWMAGAALFVVFGFPVLTAYRSAVIGGQGMNHMQVARNLGLAIKLSVAAAASGNSSAASEQTQSFLERATMKPSVELAVQNTGSVSEFQYGKSLAPLLTAFLPRIIAPNKTGADAGRWFGRDFHVSAYTDTYISPSHLGELYWNFGWPGIVLGMTLIGFLLGFVGGRCDFTQYRSVTRLLVFSSTVYLLVWGFEASIAVNYVVWLRGLAVIGALHFFLAHRPASPGSGLISGGRKIDALHSPREFANLVR